MRAASADHDYTVGPDPAETVAVFRFLVAMAAVRLGELRELGRVVREGRPVVILVDRQGERFYEVDAPQLGEAEPALVAEMLLVRGGGG